MTGSSPRVGSMFGPYRLDKLIGRGGMGEVYEAYDTTKDRIVAIKVLPERLADDPTFRQRFKRESHAAARLQEPHVIPIHDYGEIDGRLFIDMRLVQGQTLRMLLAANGALPASRAIDLVAQVGAALDAAHLDGLAHRDVKPDNILVTPGDFVYLVDFGIASSATDPRLTADGAAVGSFHYMAPERFATGNDDDTPGDVYALACVLYECLTDERPFTAGSDAAMIRSHLFEPVPKPSDLVAALPRAVDDVIARGMAKQPERRYATASELVAAARAALAGDDDSTRDAVLPVADDVTTADVTAADVTAVTVASKPTRPRRRWLPALAAGVVVIAAVATGIAVWPDGDPAPPPAAPVSQFTAADEALFDVLPPVGYNKDNCAHQNPFAGLTAVLFCDPNPAAGVPLARFYRFRDVDSLRTYYADLLRNITIDGCTGDPPGTDTVSKADGKEVGRAACYTDKSTTPPMPAVLRTFEPGLTAVVYLWNYPSGPEAFAYFRQHDSGLTDPAAGDRPRAFTDADEALLGLVPSAYSKANCRHIDPLPTTIAVIGCAHNPAVGAPGALFYSSPNPDAAKSLYESAVKNGRDVHACGGGAGSDSSWVIDGRHVGRLACLTEMSSTPPAPAIVASSQIENSLVTAEFIAEPPDSPFDAPKTEADLYAWFTKNSN